MHLWSMGLAVYRRAHMPPCSLSAPVRLPEASKRPVQAASSMTVRKVAADREAAEDDLLSHQPICHRSSRGTAEPGRPKKINRIKSSLRNQRFYALPPVQSTIFRALALAFDPRLPLDGITSKFLQ
jgi:hypothetical protein